MDDEHSPADWKRRAEDGLKAFSTRAELRRLREAERIREALSGMGVVAVEPELGLRAREVKLTPGYL